MKPNSIAIMAGIALLFIIASKANAAPAGNLQLSQLTSDPDDLNRLNALYTALLNAGLTDQQILFCLSQILHESGLFTNVANYNLMNQNNYAGLTTTSGGYASYNSVGDFVDAYLGFLTKNNNPLGATSLTDFNNRLVANNYYVPNDPATAAAYLADLQRYYNLLSQTAQ